MVGDDGQALVDVVLRDGGQRPIRAYEIVHRLTDLNAKQAKKLVDAAPQPILTRMPRAQAEAIKLELEAMGAIVELKPSESVG